LDEFEVLGLGANDETAERERRRSGLPAEVARLADDPVDRAERNRVMAEMDAITAEWPE
jgi:hypothetical protein